MPHDLLDCFRTTIRADLRRAFLSGLGLGVLVGWLTTLLGMALGWAVWHWWLA